MANKKFLELLGKPKGEYSVREMVAEIKKAKEEGVDLGQYAIGQAVEERKVGLKEKQWAETTLILTAKALWWPVIIFLLLIGPGLASIVTIFKSLNLWMWLGMLVLGILILRRMS